MQFVVQDSMRDVLEIKNRDNNSTTQLILLVASCLLYLVFFNYFLVPDPDFFDFHEHALGYLDLKLPSSFMREPLYSWLIALLTLVLRSSTLFAAEVANLVFAVLNLCLIYRIASFFVRDTSIFVVLLFAVNQETLFLAAQPLLETIFLTTILLTILLSIQGSRWCFLGACLSSLTRYEGVLLIPILVMKDLFIEKKGKFRTLVLGLLASLGIIIWMILSIRFSLLVNPYVEQWMEKGVGNIEFLKTCAQVIISFLVPTGAGKVPYVLLAFLVLILFLLGLIHLIKYSYKSASPILCFVFPYVVIHLIHPFNEPRFVVPILWIFYLFIAIGGEDLVAYIRQLSVHKPLLSVVSKLLTMVGGVCLIWWMLKLNVSSVTGDYLGTNKVLILIIYGVYSVTILLYCLSEFRKREAKYLFPILLAIAVSSIIGSSLLRAGSFMGSDEVKYYLAQFRAAGEWYRETAKPGDKLVSSFTNVIGYYSGLSGNYFLNLSTFRSHTPMEFVADLKDRSIKYIVWDGDSLKWNRQIAQSGIKSTETRYYYKQFNYYLLPYLFDPQLASYIELIKEIKVGPKTALIFEIKR